MKPHGSIRVVKNVLRHLHQLHPQVFRYLGGAKLWELASRRSYRALELTNGLRLSTVVPNQDLSGVWVTVQG
jgi:hypothetical protein